MTLTVCLPAERPDLALSAAGEDEQTHQGGGKSVFDFRQSQGLAQSLQLLVAQEAFASPLRVASDAPAGVGPLRSQPVGLRLPQDDGKYGQRPVGRGGASAERGEPFLHVRRRNRRDVLRPEPGQ